MSEEVQDEERIRKRADRLWRQLRRMVAIEQDKRRLGTPESLNEAEAFSLRINRILLELKMERSLVEIDVEDWKDPINAEMVLPWEHDFKFQQKRMAWQEALGKTIAEAHCCRYLILVGCNLCFFVGTERDRKVAIYVYAYLIRAITAEAQKRYDRAFYVARRAGNLETVHGYRTSFVTGVLAGIHERFKIQRERVEKKSGNKFALVRRADDRVQEYLDFNEIPKLEPSHYADESHQQALREGLEWARTMPLAPGLEARKQTPRLGGAHD